MEYLVNRETQKAELHFDKSEYMSLSAEQQSEIKSAYLFSRTAGAWVSRAKFPNLYRAERVAKSLGAEMLGKVGEALTFEEQMNRKAERAEARAERYEQYAANAEELVSNLADIFICDCYPKNKFQKYHLGDLKNALEVFDGNGKHAKCGDWSVAAGGYDLQFVIYYKNYEVLRCIGNELESVPYSGFTEDFAKQLKKYVRKIYPDITA